MAATSFFTRARVACYCVMGLLLYAAPGQAQVTAFMQSVAEAAAKDRAIADYYKSTNYAPIWTGPDAQSKDRRAALLVALQSAHAHGLPAARYDLNALSTDPRRVTSDRDLGRLEVELSALFLRYARDVQTGLLVPGKIDAGLVRKVPYRDRTSILRSFVSTSPKTYLRGLAPSSPEYARLMKAKLIYEKIVRQGGWGPEVQAQKLKPGQTGRAVIQMRNRLIAMGYMDRTASAEFDEKLKQAVIRFQKAHGLVADGVAGQTTIRQMNLSAKDRLSQILVAMERERWINTPRGDRHIWVNITDFSAKIIDDGKVTFQTRSVVGHRDLDRRTPEFSDVMEHMVINPTWNVPRSIAVKEYLPMMQQNPNAVGHLRLINRRGQIVSREGMDFTQFDEQTFPFDMKQPPSRGNALGLVKFMFPNRHNIYLHDTPQKKLFGRDLRAFSHGCIRLNDPFDFAYALLAKQTADPTAFFQDRLATGRETTVPLDAHVPVHLVYRTAVTDPKGGVTFRRDVYGRDAKIWNALQNAGVSLGDASS